VATAAAAAAQLEDDFHDDDGDIAMMDGEKALAVDGLTLDRL
jgi:hypothetical protein